MSWRVIAWNALPGRLLPEPVIGDDRERLPVGVVKQVLAWLDQSKPAFNNQPPTPMRIELGPGICARPPRRRKASPVGSSTKVIYQVGEGVQERFRFRHHTVEFILKNERTGMFIARYRYLAASTPDNRTIVGPQLVILQDERVSLTA